MTHEDLLAIDRLWQLLEAAETPAKAIAALEDAVLEQRTWSERCQIESAARALLVIEHFKARSRLG